MRSPIGSGRLSLWVKSYGNKTGFQGFFRHAGTRQSH